jgi:Phage virion morphogenesis family
MPVTTSGWRRYGSPLLVARDIDASEMRLRNFTLPMTEIVALSRFSTERNFRTQTAPDGRPWKEWSDSYKSRAERENTQKLVKKEEYHRGPGPSLKEAATSKDAYVLQTFGVSGAAIGGGAVAVVGSALPDYWTTHQYGGSGFGGSDVPARPFLGLSDEFQARAIQILDTHVDDSLAGFVRRTGQPIIRTPEGGFSFGRVLPAP